MDRKEFYDILIKRLLSEQMQNGEFGLSRNQSVVGVVSPYHNAYVPGKKANSFVTMYSIDVLHKLGLDTGMIKKAAAWFASRISEEGYFLSDISISEQVEDVVTGTIISVPSTIKIYRHTAEALYSLLLVDGVNRITVKMLTNILEAQNDDGGWSASSSNSKSQLLSTSFTLKAITALSANDITSRGFAPFEQEAKKNEIDTAVLMALRWLERQSRSVGGLWHLGIEKEENKAFYTGIILGMTPSLFVEQMPELTLELIGQLIACSDNGIWRRGNEIDVDGSARILSALVKLRKLMPFDFDFETSFSILQSEIEPIINEIDPATLCFIIDALYERANSYENVEPEIVNSVVAIFVDNVFLGSGFIVKTSNEAMCITCKHIFKNIQSAYCSIVCGNGQKYTCFLNLQTDIDTITTDTVAQDDIQIIPIGIKCKTHLGMQPTLPDRFYSTFGYGVSTGGRGRWCRNLQLMGRAAKGFYEMSSTDKVFEAGYSGSPVFNSVNGVVGMIQAIKGQTIYMIPSKTIVDYLEKWEDNR